MNVMISDNYKQKYLKYKTKNLNVLKYLNQKGGNLNIVALVDAQNIFIKYITFDEELTEDDTINTLKNSILRTLNEVEIQFDNIEVLKIKTIYVNLQSDMTNYDFKRGPINIIKTDEQLNRNFTYFFRLKQHLKPMLVVPEIRHQTQQSLHIKSNQNTIQNEILAIRDMTNALRKDRCEYKEKIEYGDLNEQNKINGHGKILKYDQLCDSDENKLYEIICSDEGNFINGVIFEGKRRCVKMLFDTLSTKTFTLYEFDGTFVNGEISKGEFRYGEKIGQTKLDNIFGSKLITENPIYNGTFNKINDFEYELVNGQIQYVYETHEGNFINDKLNGNGKITFADNEIKTYTGVFNNGTPIKCVGKIEYIGGEEYNGEVDNMTPNGDGEYITSNSRIIYKGKFVDGLLNDKTGHIKYFMYSGNFEEYYGEVKNNMKHGFGKFTRSMYTLEGEFNEDKFVQGKKTTQYTTCEGTFTDEILTGIGKIVSKYETREGNFINENLNGQGKLTRSNGAIIEGTFENNYIVGIGKMTDKRNNVYEGEFENNTPEGMGKWVYSNGNIYQGQISSGSPSGTGTMTYKDGKVYEGEFEFGFPIST